MQPLTRRDVLASGVAFAFFSGPAFAGHRLPRVIRPGGNSGHVRRVLSLYEMDLGSDVGDGAPHDPAKLPPPEAEVDYPVVPASIDIPHQFQAQDVDRAPLAAAPGSILVDPGGHFLYLVKDDGTARRYGVGVGREGFAWTGEAEIGMKRRWPRWVPPRDMVRRDKNARRWANGQPGGPDNPLGARALYLHRNGQDTLYRIHGTNQPDSIGRSVSSGCIRMLNEHIAELYDKVRIGTPVTVLPAHGGVSVIETSG